MIISTYKFPYLPGEEFLATEIDLMANKVSTSILILPLVPKGGLRIYSKDFISIDKSLLNINLRKSFGVKNYFFLIKCFITECIQSPDRKNYFRRPIYYLSYLKRAYIIALELVHLVKNDSLVYCYWFNDVVLYFSLLKSFGYEFKLIVRGHGGDVYEYQNKQKDFFFPFRYLQLKKINSLATISNDAKDHILAKFGDGFRSKLLVSRLGTSYYGLSPEPQSNKFVIVSCSTFFYYKRIPLLIQALSYLNDDVIWYHFGSGGDEETQSFEMAAALPGNIEVKLMGYFEKDRLMNFYLSNPINIFINVSSSEGIPVSIMEAISFGIPTLAPRVGGIPEIINDKTGILFETDSSAIVISNILSKIIKGSQKLPSRDQVHQFWSEKFSDDNYRHFYRDILCVE
jgi:glycosyltransferase involved in cell wall biosynthesis